MVRFSPLPDTGTWSQCCCPSSLACETKTWHTFGAARRRTPQRVARGGARQTLALMGAIQVGPLWSVESLDPVKSTIYPVKLVERIRPPPPPFTHTHPYYKPRSSILNPLSSIRAQDIECCYHLEIPPLQTNMDWLNGSPRFHHGLHMAKIKATPPSPPPSGPQSQG